MYWTHFVVFQIYIIEKYLSMFCANIRTIVLLQVIRFASLENSIVPNLVDGDPELKFYHTSKSSWILHIG